MMQCISFVCVVLENVGHFAILQDIIAFSPKFLTCTNEARNSTEGRFGDCSFINGRRNMRTFTLLHTVLNQVSWYEREKLETFITLEFINYFCFETGYLRPREVIRKLSTVKCSYNNSVPIDTSI
jgi:hypothetical protein